MGSRNGRFDIEALPITAEYSDKPLDKVALADALEDLLIAYQARKQAALTAEAPASCQSKACVDCRESVQ